MVDADVLDVDAAGSRRRRTAGPARPGGRARRRTPTRWPGPGRRACPGWPACRRPRARADRRERVAVARRRPRRSGRRAGRGTSPRSSSTASALAPTICCHMAGSLPATRVTSRTPWPDSARWPSGASASCPATRAASRCGRCEVRATARSCSSGGSRTRTAPHSAASSSTSADRAGVGRGVGGDRPGSAVEERRARGQRSGPLAAGHRVRPDVPSQEVGLHGRGDLVQRPGLHAAHVGDDRVGLGQRADAAPRRAGRAARPRRRAGDGPPAATGRPAPRPEAVRTCSGETSESSTSRPARRQASADRGAEQSGADDEHRPAQRGHRSSGTERTRVRSLRSDAAPCR